MGIEHWREKWQVVGELSGGGHGYTHKVRRCGSTHDSIYVLKTLKVQSSPERRARLYAEAAALRTLEHPRVAHLIDTNSQHYADPSVDLYMVTEYIDGTPMSALELPISVEDACASLDAILDALSFCHSRGHLHRDLKPDNVILRRGDVRDPVLIDFGQTFNAENPIAGFETETGQHLGNRFMHLPELMTSGADKRNALSDISFCVGLLFFLLTGQRPEALRDHQQRRPDEREPTRQHLSRLLDHQRRQLTRIFAVGFSQEFEQRWQSIGELRTQVGRLADGNFSTVIPALQERLKAVKEMMLDNPEHAIRNQFAQVHSALEKKIMESFKVTKSELQPIIGVGYGGAQFNASLGRGSATFQFHHTQYGKTLVLQATWQRERGQLSLLGDVDPNLPPFGPPKDVKGVVLNKLNFSDPELVTGLHATFESFIEEQLQAWLERLSSGLDDAR